MGAVGGVLVRQLESDLAQVRDELTKLKMAEAVPRPSAPATKIEPQAARTAAPPLLKQPALWFAVAGWAVAAALLFRRRSI
jgi:hypothetical protein